MITRPPERYVSAGRTRIRYLEAGSGPPVVLLHGLGGVSEEWLPVMAALSGAHRVIAPDLPGFGLSDKPAVSYTPDFFALAIRDLIRAMELSAVSVVGHSLGGGVTLQLAASYPEACRKLVLLAPAGLSRRVGVGIRMLATPGVGEIMLRRRRRARPASPVAETGEETHADLLRAMKRRARSTPGWREALLSTVRASITPLGLRASVTRRVVAETPGIKTPTLLIWGDRDGVVPLRDTQRIRDLLPEARLEILPGVGHDTHLECPDVVAALILSFLEG